MTDRSTPDASADESSMDDVLRELDELEETVDRREELDELQDVRDALKRLPGGEFVSERIERYTTRDVAETFVGSILISLPLLVEDGVFDIGEHFLATTLVGVPVWLVANAAFVVVLTWGLLYWADFRELRDPSPFLGVIPRRLVAVLCISLGTAALMMTLWGRVTWANPAEAFARISVIWAAAAFGGALGDILPGESRGTELREVPGKIGDRAGGLGDSLSDD